MTIVEPIVNAFEFMGSALAGGATGLIGVAMSLFGDWLRGRREDKQRAVLLADAERAARDLAESTAAAGAADVLAASIAADAATYSRAGSSVLVFVDLVRGLTRPVLTLYLCVAISIFYFTTDMAALRLEILQTALYLTTAAVLWWFGTRPMRRS